MECERMHALERREDTRVGERRRMGEERMR
jgi:hypothetical protein